MRKLIAFTIVGLGLATAALPASAAGRGHSDGSWAAQAFSHVP